MDDSQRAAIGSLGVGLMVGAIAWVSAVSIASSRGWPVRVLIPAAMFVVGAALLVWAAQSSRTSRRAVLGRAIAEGQKMLQSQWFTGNLWLEWQNTTADALRKHVGSLEAHEFIGARGPGDALGGKAEGQISYLEGLRKRRFDKRR